MKCCYYCIFNLRNLCENGVGNKSLCIASLEFLTSFHYNLFNILCCTKKWRLNTTYLFFCLLIPNRSLVERRTEKISFRVLFYLYFLTNLIYIHKECKRAERICNKFWFCSLNNENINLNNTSQTFHYFCTYPSKKKVCISWQNWFVSSL